MAIRFDKMYLDAYKMRMCIGAFSSLNVERHVILVGHDIGGAYVSYAMELHRSKVSKAVFIAAAMLKNGQRRKMTSVTSLRKSFSGKEVDAQHKRISPQSTPLPTLKRCEGALFLHYFSSLFLSKFRVSIVVLLIHIPVRISKIGSNDLCQHSQKFLYANGKNHPPTAIDFDKSLLKDGMFNQSTAKDFELVSVLLRPIHLAPLIEKLSLSATNYGSNPRFFVKSIEDFAIAVFLW
ncbi:hypothetical protein H5410_001202 [Solanum commersonii]|uniref:AB hydrolase-1 domain-containing protein n=1 Tax=Solanum commersonii TaxID=4109 RepID=A0A9J6AY04_SOLCO|nr:hypothetical protein H5410_001202 [Solanum commersonii]